eukprot:GHVP01024702.1.p1 GENE.GHVP01024702.1~~GHVP01024702.1.p1  ORF type:complete len:268 (+),score=42.41 GHVP01024702.1:164-967(+)
MESFVARRSKRPKKERQPFNIDMEPHAVRNQKKKKLQVDLKVVEDTKTMHFSPQTRSPQMARFRKDKQEVKIKYPYPYSLPYQLEKLANPEKIEKLQYLSDDCEASTVAGTPELQAIDSLSQNFVKVEQGFAHSKHKHARLVDRVPLSKFDRYSEEVRAYLLGRQQEIDLIPEQKIQESVYPIDFHSIKKKEKLRLVRRAHYEARRLQENPYHTFRKRKHSQPPIEEDLVFPTPMEVCDEDMQLILEAWTDDRDKISRFGSKLCDFL